MPGHQPCGIKQGAIAADGDDEIRPGGERLLGAWDHAVSRKRETEVGVDQGAQPFRMEVSGQAQHALGDAQILGVADQCDGLKGMRHNESL